MGDGAGHPGGRTQLREYIGDFTLTVTGFIEVAGVFGLFWWRIKWKIESWSGKTGPGLTTSTVSLRYFESPYVGVGVQMGLGGKSLCILIEKRLLLYT